MIIIQKNVLMYLLLLILVSFYSGSAISTVSSYFRNSIILIAICLVIVRIVKKKNYLSFTNNTFFLFLFLSMIFMNMLIFGYSSFYIRLISTIYIAYEIVEYVNCKKFIVIFQNVMTAITCIAIIGYIFVNVFHFSNMFFQFTNINGESYNGFILFNYIIRLPERNCAFFWEPGLFSTALTFALIIELNFTNVINWRRVLIYVVGIVTSQSTAGYILLLMVGVLWSLKINPRQRKLRILIYILQLFIIILSIIMMFNLDSLLDFFGLSENPIFSKLMSETFIDSQRGRAIYDGIMYFIKNPLIGNGIHNISNSMNYIGDTATVFYFLSIFGMMGILYFLFFMIGVLKQYDINMKVKLVLLVILFMILNKENHSDLLFTWIFGFYLLKNSNRQRRESLLYKS